MISSMTDIAAVILAAGAATRMGEHKMLLLLGAETIIRRSVRILLETGYKEVLVVLGREPERVQANLEGLPCSFAINPDFATMGMERSLRCAVEHLPSDATALHMTLADQVFVTPQMHRTLLDTHLEHQPLVTASRFGEIIAPPHIFSSELFDVLGTPGYGAKPLIKANPDRARFVEHPTEALFDIDTPEDYALAQQRMQKNE
jgi:molybdenum cofactor cytidylyltransferase